MLFSLPFFVFVFKALFGFSRSAKAGKELQAGPSQKPSGILKYPVLVVVAYLVKNWSG